MSWLRAGRWRRFCAARKVLRSFMPLLTFNGFVYGGHNHSRYLFRLCLSNLPTTKKSPLKTRTHSFNINNLFQSLLIQLWLDLDIRFKFHPKVIHSKAPKISCFIYLFAGWLTCAMPGLGFNTYQCRVGTVIHFL